MSSEPQKQSSLSQYWQSANHNKPLQRNKNKNKNKNETNTSSKNSHKRTRQQSDDENYPHNLPLKRPHKRAKISCNTQNTPKAPKRQIMNESETESDNENETDQNGDIGMRLNQYNSNNHNKNNTNNNSDLSDSEDDTLSRFTQFDFKQNENESECKQKLIERDSKYKNDSYNPCTNATPNIKKKKSLKIAGDVSKAEWFVNPRDKSGRTADDPNYNRSQIYIPPSAYKQMKPLRKQWWELKSDHFDGVLFFKKANFYNLLYEDAYIGHKINGLALNTDDTNTPRVGFPEQSFIKYAESFVKHGYKVYRVEQMETAEQQKKRKGKLMKRKVCEVLSKGTLIPLEFLDERANFILSIVEQNDNQKISSIDVGVCYSDFSTGDIYVSHFIDDRNRARLRTLLFQINPSEIIYKRKRLSKESMSLLKNESPLSTKTALKEEDEFYSAQKTKNILKHEQYWMGDQQIPNVLQNVWNNNIIMNAIGGVLYMLQHTMHDKEILPHSYWHMYDPTDSKSNNYLTLDGSTLGNLEILSNCEGTRSGTLIEFMDHCYTKFGSRMLETWLKYPLNNLDLINERLDAVQYLIEDNDYWNDIIHIKQKLKRLPDLERLLHHLAVLGTKNRMMDSAVMYDACKWNKRKVKKLIDAMDGMEQIRQLLTDIEQHGQNIKSKLIHDITTVINNDNEDCDGDIKINQAEEKVHHKNNSRYIKEFNGYITEFKQSFDREYALKTGIIQPTEGYDEIYDKLLTEIEQNENELQDILTKIRKKYNSTQIKYNHPARANIRGKYLIEVPKRLNIKIPKQWESVGSTAKVIRYQSKDIGILLKVKESLHEKKEALERDCAREMFEKFGQNGTIWKQIVHNIAILDCLLSLCHTSELAPGFEMSRPQFIRKQNENDRAFLEIRQCTHPCVFLNDSSVYIPNDTVLGTKENNANFVIVTGPNMGGKSTLLRQTCIAVIMAHIGCYVPCDSMRLTTVDRIFTRVGANDRILAGQSTFMVELEETSNILRHATNNSLVILDELGRGTSTFDGTAIAFAVAKMVIETIKCRCLFSTHYHGLCDSFISDDKYNNSVAMYHMTYKQDIDKQTITFLYKFMKGICKQSHGINCAKLAGLSEQILNRAKEKAKILHERMHAQQNNAYAKDEKELLQQFKEIRKAVFDDTLWDKLQNDLKT